jgi:hypothetical protein
MINKPIKENRLQTFFKNVLLSKYDKLSNILFNSTFVVKRILWRNRLSKTLKPETEKRKEERGEGPRPRGPLPRSPRPAILPHVLSTCPPAFWRIRSFLKKSEYLCSFALTGSSAGSMVDLRLSIFYFLIPIYYFLKRRDTIFSSSIL